MDLFSGFVANCLRVKSGPWKVAAAAAVSGFSTFIFQPSTGSGLPGL